MATLASLAASPSPPSSPTRRRKSFFRRCERLCCSTIIYFPLLFIYSLTSWAVWVEASIGFLPRASSWTGRASSILGIALYALLNSSYSIAVFTDPGSPSGAGYGYSQLPTSEPAAHPYTSFTVKSTGDLRFCKKCQCKKPDRTHHCSTCRRCVLKMDHHCPWLATCVGLRNYKPFLLFLIHTSLFCWLCFAVTATWLWTEIFSDAQFEETLMPVNYIMLAVLSGIIGLVLTGFAAWHVYMTSQGRTTIETLESTRYLSPLKKSMQQQQERHYVNGERDHHTFGEQLVEIHANMLPGVTRTEEGEERSSPLRGAPMLSWEERERRRDQERYDQYRDEKDSERLPNAFDVGWRKNLSHVFGPSPALWLIPVCNSMGDGWSWEPNPKWIQSREQIRREREAEVNAQQQRETAAGWGQNVSNSWDYSSSGASS
ncbi:zf-DHHC-domain-containing protein [Aulographum hederae CBS 113979]|uniref:Palmitoyltransferase n=1 Tax=Aulographum hederae CBS 113979 TaxID=1176131 RepID=A0A6G1GUR6_9PEZI|nr:zf-DHHC-domain-containing protein [Aulographum hederae CBS 113979]